MSLNTELSTVVQRTGSTTGTLATQSERTAFARAVRLDLANVIAQINSVYQPLLAELVSEVGLDALDTGLVGNVIKTHADATSGSASAFWNSTKSRPRTVKETVDVILSELSRIENLANTSGGIQLAAIRSYVGMPTSTAVPEYTEYGPVTTVSDGDSLTEAIQKLDAAIESSGGDGGAGGFGDAHVVVVDPVEGAGDYTSIQDAIDYCVTQSPSAANMFYVIVNPGTYAEDIEFAPFVHVHNVISHVSGEPLDMTVRVDGACTYAPSSASGNEFVIISGLSFVSFSAITAPLLTVTGTEPTLIVNSCGFGVLSGSSGQPPVIVLDGDGITCTIANGRVQASGSDQIAVQTTGADMMFELQKASVQSNHIGIDFNTDEDENNSLKLYRSNVRGLQDAIVATALTLDTQHAYVTGDTNALNIGVGSAPDVIDLYLASCVVRGNITIDTLGALSTPRVAAPLVMSAGTWTVGADIEWYDTMRPTPKLVLGDTTYNMSAVDEFVEVNSTDDAVVINLPALSSVQLQHVRWIKDIAGQASTHNITVYASGTERIDGAAYQVISTDHGCIGLRPHATGGSWVVVAQR